MKRMDENVSRYLQKFTSEITLVGKHNVVDLTDEDEVIKAFRAIQNYIFGILQEASDIKTAPDRFKALMSIVSKGKRELKELKPYIKPETVYELEMSFRNLGDIKPKQLSEHKESADMDKKLDNGFEDAIDELVGLSGAYEVSDEPMKNCCDIFADVATELDCQDEESDGDEMSDAMGMELKDNDEDELTESVEAQPDDEPKVGDVVRVKDTAEHFQGMVGKIVDVYEVGQRLFDTGGIAYTIEFEDGEQYDALPESFEVIKKAGELNESIRDYLPKAGAFRDEDGKMVGGFIGNGSKDRIEKAKKLAKAKFYNGERLGRVTDEEIDNFDEVYAKLMHRDEDGMNETVEVQPDMLDSDFDRLYIDGAEVVNFYELDDIIGQIDPNFEFVSENSNEKYTYFRFENRKGLSPKEATRICEKLKARLEERYGSSVVVKDIHTSTWSGVSAFVIRVVNSDLLYETAKSKRYLKNRNETTVEDRLRESKYFDVKDFDFEIPEENPSDTIKMDVPLFMRCLEFAREDAQDDADLHHLVEKATELSKMGDTLTMDNYKELTGDVDTVVEESKDPKTNAEWKTARQNAKANPSLYGGRYTDKDPKKARKEWEADRKENLKEGCVGKRKWKRIKKKTK